MTTAVDTTSGIKSSRSVPYPIPSRMLTRGAEYTITPLAVAYTVQSPGRVLVRKPHPGGVGRANTPWPKLRYSAHDCPIPKSFFLDHHGFYLGVILGVFAGGTYPLFHGLVSQTEPVVHAQRDFLPQR